MAELQAERRREAERIKEQIEGSNAVGAGMQRQSSVGSAAGGYDMIVASGRRRSESDNESAASREYWASRAVAQAAKARVEQGPFAQQSPIAAPQQQSRIQQQVQLTQQQQQPSSQYGARGGGSSNDDYSSRRSDVTPEERIAMLKAEKERAKDLELAERQRELQQAHEANREQRRNLEEKMRREKQSLAFNVDMGGAGIIGGGNAAPNKVSQKQGPSSDYKEERKSVRDESPGSEMSLLNPANLPASKYAPSPQRGDPSQVTPKSGQSNNSNPRKKWETPISAEELRLVAAGGGIASSSNNNNNSAQSTPAVPDRPRSVMKDEDDEDYDMDELATLKKGAFYKERARGGRRGSDSDSSDDRDKRLPRDAKRGDADSDDDASPWPNQRDVSADGPVAAQELQEQEQAVMSRLQQQERRQQTARAEAKEVKT